MELSRYNSNFRGNWYRIIFTLLLCVIVGVTLLSSNLFIYASLTPFYLYIIGISLVVIAIGLFFIIKPTTIVITWPVILVFLWLLYILGHGYFGNTFNSFHLYLSANLILLIILNVLFRIEVIRFNLLFRGVSLFAAIEASLCIGQFFGVFHTYNRFFTVTGSWENPNVTAMFLTMTIPVIIQLIISGKSIQKLLSFVILCITIIAMVLLQCRTALVGSIVAAFVLFNFRYGIANWLKSKNNRAVSMLIGIMFIASATPLINYLYNAKKASADGRKLIWKLSTKMILDRPVSGYGYGLFEKNYNIFQSNYLKAGNGSYEEIQQAGFVHMGYNEFLENTVEGGLPGLIFIGGFFLILLRVPISKATPAKTKSASENYFIMVYAGVAAFIAMSLCNFTVQAIPAMCLFILYAAILFTHPSFSVFSITNSSSRLFAPLYTASLSVGAVLLGLFILYQNLSTSYASFLNKKAAIQAKHGNNQLAIQTLSPLTQRLNAYESYWTNLARIYMAEKDYVTAITLFDKAKAYTSDPEIFIRTALCYQKIGDYQSSESNYLFAEYVEPSRLSPKIGLMNLYWKEKDTIKAVAVAKQIINQKLKIPSREANHYKHQAQRLLKYLDKDADNQHDVKLPAFLHKSI